MRQLGVVERFAEQAPEKYAQRLPVGGGVRAVDKSGRAGDGPAVGRRAAGTGERE